MEIEQVGINMDENPGLVGRIMRDKQYTFPVFLAKSQTRQKPDFLGIGGTLGGPSRKSQTI